MNVTHSQSALMAENKRLREQLAALREEKQAPITVDPAEGRVTIENYQTDQFTINRLEAQSEGIVDIGKAMSQVERWVGPNSQSTPDFSQSLRKKIRVDSLKMTVPFETINTTLPKIAGPQLREAGIREIQVGPGQRPNEVAIEGRVKKLLEVGFDAVGEMSVTPSGQSKFVLKKTRVAGVPMPNFLTALVTKVFAGESMREFGVEQNGSEFTVDPAKLMPPNIDTQLTALKVDQTGFIIESGQDQTKSLEVTADQKQKKEELFSLSAWNHAPMMV